MISDDELGRRLAALRSYRRLDQTEIRALAAERGYPRGFGNSMVSAVENGTRPNGTDLRSARVLCDIYEFDFDTLVDPNAELFARPAMGIIEELQARFDGLTSVVGDVAAQLAAVQLEAATSHNSEQVRPEESQAD